LAVGAVNGLLISVLRLQPFLVTLATWSILSGHRCSSCPSTAAPCRVNGCGSAMPSSSTFDISLDPCSPLSVLDVVSRYAARARYPRRRLEREVRLSVGVSLTFINVGDLWSLGPLASLAALYLTTQTCRPPTIGKDYILSLVAAAVIGGISLFGGRGGLRAPLSAPSS